jgi:uncharacterized membrane protein YraQ (UPF0718 family)
MLPNNFQNLFCELDNVAFSAKNLVINEFKVCKEKISQLPKNVIPYVKRYGPYVVPYVIGAALSVGTLASMIMYPSNQQPIAKTSTQVALGCLMMFASHSAFYLRELWG